MVTLQYWLLSYLNPEVSRPWDFEYFSPWSCNSNWSSLKRCTRKSFSFLSPFEDECNPIFDREVRLPKEDSKPSVLSDKLFLLFLLRRLSDPAVWISFVYIGVDWDCDNEKLFWGSSIEVNDTFDGSNIEFEDFCRMSLLAKSRNIRQAYSLA